MSFGWKDSVVIRTNYLTKEERMTQIFLASGEGVLYNYHKKTYANQKNASLLSSGTQEHVTNCTRSLRKTCKNSCINRTMYDRKWRPYSRSLIQIPPDHAIEWHGLGRAIAAHETPRSSLCLSLCSFADCRVPRALAGAIEADGISQETDSEANGEDRP